jgi:hypothetical protein
MMTIKPEEQPLSPLRYSAKFLNRILFPTNNNNVVALRNPNQTQRGSNVNRAAVATTALNAGVGLLNNRGVQNLIDRSIKSAYGYFTQPKTDYGAKRIDTPALQKAMRQPITQEPYMASGLSHAAVSSMREPKWKMKNGVVSIEHSEMISSVWMNPVFTALSFPINPANPTLFPYLSNIARNFEQWSTDSIVFHYKPMTSMSTSTPGLGSVTMATQYDVFDDVFDERRQMLATLNAESSAPVNALSHVVRTVKDRSQFHILKVRDAGFAEERKQMYDLATTTVAVEGGSAEFNAGELWISYSIKFYKPKFATPYDEVRIESDSNYTDLYPTDHALYSSSCTAPPVVARGLLVPPVAFTADPKQLAFYSVGKYELEIVGVIQAGQSFTSWTTPINTVGANIKVLNAASVVNPGMIRLICHIIVSSSDGAVADQLLTFNNPVISGGGFSAITHITHVDKTVFSFTTTYPVNAIA